MATYDLDILETFAVMMAHVITADASEVVKENM